MGPVQVVGRTGAVGVLLAVMSVVLLVAAVPVLLSSHLNLFEYQLCMSLTALHIDMRNLSTAAIIFSVWVAVV